MYSRIKSQTPFSIVKLSEAKRQLNEQFNDDNDTHIQMLIDIASDLAQSYTNRLLSTGVIELVVSGKKSFFLPYGEATEDITPIVATVTDDPVTFDFEPISQIFTFDDGVINSTDRVKLTYDAGYASGKVPPSVKMGVLMLISTLYEWREDYADVSVNNIPIGSTQLLDSVKIQAF